MPDNNTDDKSNGYERIEHEFMRARNPRIGPSTVEQWSHSLPPACAILELGCGHGVISQVLIARGFVLYAIDASPSLLDAFRQRFPAVITECAAAEDSDFFQRTFDAAVAWGLMFLLEPGAQAKLIHKVAGALNSGGKFLFTAPEQVCTWSDAQTGCRSVSLGRDVYVDTLQRAGLELTGELSDEGDNHYFVASKPLKR